MASYSTRIDPDTGITHIEVTGAITLDALYSYMQTEPFRNRTLLLLCDLRKASFAGLSRNVLMKFVRDIKGHVKPGIRAAYVYGNSDDYSKGRLFIVQAQTTGYEGDFKVFQDYDAAVKWVSATLPR